MANKPLILITNDDGINSPGLQAVAEAVVDLGDLLIMAPSSQKSGAGRSYLPVIDRKLHKIELLLNGSQHIAYKADVSPAQAVAIAASDLTERPIDLCISGINYGENVGSGVTISGTVGAAIEAACRGIPAMAVSLQTKKKFHRNNSNKVDFKAAAHFTRLFACKILDKGLPPKVDLLKIEIPIDATTKTAWCAATVSRIRYYEAINGKDSWLDKYDNLEYTVGLNLHTLETQSDVYVLAIQKFVAVSPMTIDLTAPVSLEDMTDFFSDFS